MKGFLSLRLLILVALLGEALSGNGQWNESDVLTYIQSLQVVDDPFYSAGLFPSQREWTLSSETVEDNTIFFTASIVVTLQQLREHMNDKQQAVIDHIIEKARKVYPLYQSRNGEPTFNFWQTVTPDLPFPNGSKLLSNESMRLPDDLNSSSLIARALQDDSLSHAFREKMVRYATRINRDESDLITPDAYEDVMAYEVWFAKEMPQTYDICVLSNILCFVMENQFAWTTTDSASVNLIKAMIKDDAHLNETRYISHHVSSPGQILYHVARVMATDESGLFNEIKSQVIDDINHLLTQTENEVEKILLLSSLHRLGQKTAVTPDWERLKQDVKTFVFFSIKPFGSGFSRLKLDGLSPTIRWYCEAYNQTLVLEYLVLSGLANE